MHMPVETIFESESGSAVRYTETDEEREARLDAEATEASARLHVSPGQLRTLRTAARPFAVAFTTTRRRGR